MSASPVPVSEPPVSPAPRTSSRRKWIIIAIVVILIGSAAGGAYLLLRSQTVSLRVETTTVNWIFGDGAKSSGTSTSTSHAYATAGTYFVGSQANLSGGSSVNNFDALYVMTVGPPKDLTTRDSLGVIAINRTASAPGAPLIAAGKWIAAVGSVQQAPSYTFSVKTTPSLGTTQWDNYSWAVQALSFSFGDGAAPVFNISDQPYRINHTYASAGIYQLALAVATQNQTMRTTCDVTGCSSTPLTNVMPFQIHTTVVGQTIAVGTYKLLTYSGSVVNPGLVVVQEAVTGSYTTLDPGADYESVGFETIANTYQTLLWYDGTKSDVFVPVLADKIPSTTDGSISADHKTYTFHLRPGAKFADGTAVTPWDVKYSFTRTMLFVFGDPFTSGWIQSQYLLPSISHADLTFDNVNNAVSVDNTTGNVTFHLAYSVPELLWFQIIADPLGSSVVSWKWLEANGPKLVWTPAGFANYQKYGNLTDYVPYWRDHTMGSGPYAVDYVVPGESVALKRNPNFQALPGIPAPTVERVFLQYVESASTRELSLESGQADITTYNPSNRFDVMRRMQTDGLVHIEFVPTLNLFWWNFNMEIAPSSDNTVPSDFFVDQNMRKAFFYAYDFGNYLDEIVGNKHFNAKFADTFNGIIPNGMIGYENLSSNNVFDLVRARQYYNQTAFVTANGGWANAAFTLTIVVPTADPVNLAEARAWGNNLQRLGPPGKIVINTLTMSFHDIIAESSPHTNRMALWYLGWLPDYPYPTDYTYPMLEPANAAGPGGTYPTGNGFNISYLRSKGQTAQADAAQNISDWINASLTETDINLVVDLSRRAQREAMLNLTIYVPAQQQYSFFVYRTWIQGIPLEGNPMLGGTDILYNLLTKSGTIQGAVATSSSPGPGTVGGLGAPSFLVPLSLLVFRRKPESL